MNKKITWIIPIILSTLLGFFVAEYIKHLDDIDSHKQKIEQYQTVIDSLQSRILLRTDTISRQDYIIDSLKYVLSQSVKVQTIYRDRYIKDIKSIEEMSDDDVIKFINNYLKQYE